MVFYVVYRDVDFLGDHGIKTREFDTMTMARFVAESIGEGACITSGSEILYIVGKDRKVHKVS